QETGLKPGQQLEYYFEVWDNDGAGGPKVSRSAVKTYRAPSEEEIKKTAAQTSASLQKNMQQAVRKAGEIEREAKQLGQELLGKKDLSYPERKKIEQLADEHKQLEELVNKIKQENQKAALQQETENRAILEKQKQIEDLFNNV